MIEQDTVRLLRECDAGVKMGVASLEDVMPAVHSPALLRTLSVCREEHEALSSQIQQQLDRFGDEGKNPSPIAQKMSWVKTKLELGLESTDAVIADLMTDGCNMGVKSLNRYLNQYEAADERSKDMAKRLIHLEQQLVTDIQGYL